MEYGMPTSTEQVWTSWLLIYRRAARHKGIGVVRFPASPTGGLNRTDTIFVISTLGEIL